MKDCEYCDLPGTKRAGKEDGLDGDAFVCDSCWSMLRNPTLGLQLIRGHLTLKMRNMNKRDSASINTFMDALSRLPTRKN